MSRMLLVKMIHSQHQVKQQQQQSKLLIALVRMLPWSAWVLMVRPPVGKMQRASKLLEIAESLEDVIRSKLRVRSTFL